MPEALACQGTVIRCQHDHPVPAATRRHGATLGKLPGEWLPTGQVVTVDHPKELIEVEVRPGYHLAYCKDCRAVTEYRQANTLEV